jgi:hypothetical protein
MLISTNEPLLNVSQISLLRRTLEAKNLFFPTSAQEFKYTIEQIVVEGTSWKFPFLDFLDFLGIRDFRENRENSEN